MVSMGSAISISSSPRACSTVSTTSLPSPTGLEADLAFLSRCARLDSLACAENAKTDNFDSNKRRSAVLVATGSFCPPHVGHLHMLQAASRSLGDVVDIVGAIMVPSSDEYISHKAQSRRDNAQQPPYKVRAALLEAMAMDLNLGFQIHVSDAEAERDFFYLDVVKHLAHEASQSSLVRSSNAKLQLIFVTGADRWSPLLTRFEGGDGVVVVPRADDETIPLRSAWPQWAQQDPCRVVAEPIDDTISTLSSTRLRKAIDAARKEKSDEPPQVMHEAVAFAVMEFMTPAAATIYAKWLLRDARE